MTPPPRPTLDRARHIKYWLRCLKTCLPTEYTSTDLSRLTLAFFCISALDLLGELSTVTTPEERSQWINWVYRNQHPSGGFRGSPATDFGAVATTENRSWDPAHLPATCFALITLVTLGDDLSRFDRRGALELLPKLQRDDGSFGEWRHESSGEVIGGTDMRHMYFASAIRWALRGRHSTGVEDVPDFDVDKAVAFIRASQTYDSGISEKPFGEAHGGLFTDCVAVD